MVDVVGIPVTVMFGAVDIAFGSTGSEFTQPLAANSELVANTTRAKCVRGDMVNLRAKVLVRTAIRS
jgi:hypothetical protein